MQRTLTHVLLIIAIGCLVLFTNLGKTRLWDRDEPQNAGCALEMMERGNLVVPIFNDELRTQKPALLYWLIIGAYKIFGVSEFAARFWSAILGIGTALATYGIGRRLLNPAVALYGAIILATSMMFVVSARTATPDSVVIFCSTMSMLFYVLGTFAPRTHVADAPTQRWEGYFFPQRYSCIFAMYAMMGLAVIAGGPVGFVLPFTIIGMFMLIMRLPPIDNEAWNSRGWLARATAAGLRPFQLSHVLKTLRTMRPIILASTVMLIAAPWYFAVGAQTNWEWPKQFLFTENLALTTSTFGSKGGIFYYPVAILLGFFPWSVFFGPMVLEIDRQVTRRHHWRIAYVFLLSWIGIQVGLYSLAPTKLPGNVTPCYPALALLTGAFLHQLVIRRTATSVGFNRFSFIAMIVCGLLITGGLVITGNAYLSGDIRIATVGLIPVLGGVIALVCYLQEKNSWSVIACCVCAVVFATGTFGFGAMAVDRHQQSHALLERVANSEHEIPVATYGCLESSWIYYAERPLFELSPLDKQGQWSDHRVNAWDRKSLPSPEQFVLAHPNAMIITKEQDLEQLKKRLPGEYRIIKRAPYFLRNSDLVLLAPGPVKRVATAQENQRR